MSLSIAVLAACVAGVWGFFFAVRPVWSASEQMQASLVAKTDTVVPIEVVAPVPSPRMTWEEAKAAYAATIEDVALDQQLSRFDGVEPEDFFRLRNNPLVSPTSPEIVTGAVKLYMIPGKTYFFRLEDFEVPVGPDYQIGLTTARAPSTGQEIRTAARYQFLSTMENFRGSRNILINPDVLALPDQRPTRFNTLVVWNAEYDVVVATASLE